MQRGIRIALIIVAIAVTAWWPWPKRTGVAATDEIAVVAAPVKTAGAGRSAGPRPVASVMPVGPVSPIPAATAGAAPADMMVAAMPVREDEPRGLHARFQAEARDANWAPRAEAILRDRLADVPGIHDGADAATVACRATVCEVAGIMPTGMSDTAVGAAMAALQAPDLTEGAARQGLSNRAAMFGNREGRASYALFFERR